ncbi:MAG: translation initiation factor IF-2 subunit gamma [archaeon]
MTKASENPGEKKAGKRKVPSPKKASAGSSVPSSAAGKETAATHLKHDETEAHSSPVQLVPVLNIGTSGQIDHGKTTVTKAITGKWADVHSEELKRGMTIRLGYADVVFRKCPKCPNPDGYTIEEKCKHCGSDTKVLRVASFVDAPGHEALMSTMLAGAAIMDGALLVISAKDSCPQPQTKEHVAALKIMGVKNLLVLQNKIDLVDEARARESVKEIQAFLSGYGFESVPIIPISALHGANIDVVLEAIDRFLPDSTHDETKPAKFLVARSFDINRPGTEYQKLRGGILGGALVQGVLSVGTEVEILPGFRSEENGRTKWIPLKAKVKSLSVGRIFVEKARPGGSLGIGTNLDPALTKSDSLSGSVVGPVGKLPPIQTSLKMEVSLLPHVVGTENEIAVEPIKLSEPLLLNINSGMTSGIVSDVKGKRAAVALKVPVCADTGDRVAISRRVGQRWRLIGHGILVA